MEQSHKENNEERQLTSVEREIFKIALEILKRTKKEIKRKIFILRLKRFIYIGIVLALALLPSLLSKKLTCEEMKTAPFYQKIHYYTSSPALAHPCDSTSPFWSPYKKGNQLPVK
ncbi:hypothetical protein [Sphingobacterium faecium]|uniref:hypothetical protein n=1 Tax=Sphingobacterium faecium TaxID=34087 RepID=UPI000D37179A|nr:hypothetical protein [Sphingobacterium faecium]PTX09459.1 hypothetical protein C8N37_10687 [Sphingobacterium faecium]